MNRCAFVPSNGATCCTSNVLAPSKIQSIVSAFTSTLALRFPPYSAPWAVAFSNGQRQSTVAPRAAASALVSLRPVNSTRVLKGTVRIRSSQDKLVLVRNHSDSAGIWPLNSSFVSAARPNGVTALSISPDPLTRLGCQFVYGCVASTLKFALSAPPCGDRTLLASTLISDCAMDLLVGQGNNRAVSKA